MDFHLRAVTLYNTKMITDELIQEDFTWRKIEFFFVVFMYSRTEGSMPL